MFFKLIQNYFLRDTGKVKYILGYYLLNCIMTTVVVQWDIHMCNVAGLFFSGTNDNNDKNVYVVMVTLFITVN